MTHNQIAYAQHKETERSNLAKEQQARNELAETSRHNLVYEAETNRHNLATEQETNRANLAKEQLQAESNAIGWAQAQASAQQAAAATRNAATNAYNAQISAKRQEEDARHNYAAELETQSHNDVMEGISQSEAEEKARHNKAQETIDSVKVLTSGIFGLMPMNVLQK